MFKETGAMLPEVSAAGKKVEKKDSTVNIEKEKDPIKERLLNFLKDEKIIQEMNGYPIVDVAKMESPEFKRRLRRLYLGRKNNTTLLGSMKIIKEKLQDFKGVPAEDFSHSLRINGNVHLKEVFSPKENYLKSKLLSFLEKTGILEMTDNGKNIFDIEKFLHTDFSTKNRAFIKGVKLQRYPAKAEIFEKLSDLKVVSKSDFEASGGKAEEIPLFNVPESIDEAYDIEKMRNKKYYLNYWDFYNYNKKQGISWNYKIKAKNGEKIEARELALATKIFRDFQGKRDSKGQLFVFDKEKGRFERLSIDWMKKTLGNFGSPNKSNNYDTPHIFLLKFCPNLVRKKLIDIGDYGINTMGSSGNLLRKEFKIYSKSPYVMIKSARYYIGRNFFYYNKEKIPTENLKITVLDKNTAGIIETHKGKERLRYILPLISDQEREMKEQQIKERFGKLPRKKVSALLVMGKEDTAKRIYEWKPTKDNPIRENETAEEYAERIRRIGDFEYIKEISNDFSRECLLGIHNLSWREQQWLCGAAFELGKDYSKLLEFGREYGLTGLRTFLSCEYDIKIARKILELGFSTDKEVAHRIFEKYGEIIETAENLESEMKECFYKNFELTEADRRKIRQNLLKEATQLLERFHENSEKEQLSKEKILNELEKIKTEILLVQKVIYQLPREEVSKLDLKGIYPIQRIEDIEAAELLKKPELIEKMKKIIQQQFPEGDDEIFEEECRRNKNLKLTITLANNEILSFFSKEKKSENVTYIDWFMANPDAPIKGLGEATLRLGFDEEHEKKAFYYAVAKPHAKSFQILVENLGFVSFGGSTADGEYKHHYARIRRLPEDADLIGKNIPIERKSAFMENIKKICFAENNVYPIIYEGKVLYAAKIKYEDRTFRDDIKETDQEGWILREIKNQQKNGRILSRFIPESADKNNQTYYAIFEDDRASDKNKAEISEIIQSRLSSVHSDSKKAFNI